MSEVSSPIEQPSRNLNTTLTNQHLLHSYLPVIPHADYLDKQNYFRWSQQVKVVLKRKGLKNHLLSNSPQITDPSEI